ncbi:LysR family transcriptional regulator [Xylophilus sp. GOD-11R]|uniref:LysR family transcriptional regulator n=1 Tax=Xylophilus sp. GOD-11R TaxID=3089814 RepID=UPI00298D11BF|nr:LysR family transcriptional regulator [Xylophilus sp. GOD-11R]WPB54920.1 LysR family transcriptional regulator [Xylophilus sp. GOD-11R]
MFQLSQLRCFVTVATELHFGRAAALLHMTQPPLTRQIQLLEHELNVRLLDRSGGAVRLTPAGAAFLPEAEDLLRRAQAATLAARRAVGGQAGSVTLGFIPAASFALLPRLLAAAQARLPGVQVILREMQTADQLEALGADRIDLAIVRPFAPRSFVESASLMVEPFVAALPASHALAAQQTVALAQLEGEPLIQFAPSESRYLYELVAGRFQAAGVRPEPVQTMSHTHSILALVDAGMGLALVPRSARALRFEGVALRPLAEVPGMPPLEVEQRLAWRRNAREGVAVSMRQLLLEQAAVPDQPRSRATC